MKRKTKHILISSISFVYFVIVLFYIFMDGFGKKGSSGVSGFIEQDNLRKSLGDWYQLVFFTFQTNIYFLIIGMSYVFLHDNRVIKNLFFCSTSFLLFCLFAISVFDFSSFKDNPYESSKTLFLHLIIPVSSFIMLISIRKEIILEWKWLIVNSLYVVLYLVMCVIIYYQFKFSSDSQYPNQPLWIYKFLDFNNQIMFIPLPGMALTVVGIIILFIVSFFVSIVLFIFMKYVSFIKLIPLNLNRKNLSL